MGEFNDFGVYDASSEFTSMVSYHPTYWEAFPPGSRIRAMAFIFALFTGPKSHGYIIGSFGSAFRKLACAYSMLGYQRMPCPGDIDLLLENCDLFKNSVHHPRKNARAYIDHAFVAYHFWKLCKGEMEVIEGGSRGRNNGSPRHADQYMRVPFSEVRTHQPAAKRRRAGSPMHEPIVDDLTTRMKNLVCMWPVYHMINDGVARNGPDFAAVLPMSDSSKLWRNQLMTARELALHIMQYTGMNFMPVPQAKYTGKFAGQIITLDVSNCAIEEIVRTDSTANAVVYFKGHPRLLPTYPGITERLLIIGLNRNVTIMLNHDDHRKSKLVKDGFNIVEYDQYMAMANQPDGEWTYQP